MKWALTFRFKDTEEQAKQFCDEVYNGYSPYAKRKFKLDQEKRFFCKKLIKLLNRFDSYESR